MKSKLAFRAFMRVLITYFVLLIIYIVADANSTHGGLPMPKMSEFVLLGIAIFSLLAFIFTLIRFCVKENVSKAGFILHGLIFILFLINMLFRDY